MLRPKLQGALLLDRLTRLLPIRTLCVNLRRSPWIGLFKPTTPRPTHPWTRWPSVRRAAGLPAVSIAWGAWAEIGAAARAGEGVARRGLMPMAPSAALEALGLAMTSADPVLGVLDVDWGRFLDRFPAGGVPPLFAELAPSRSSVRAEAAAHRWSRRRACEAS